MLPFANRDRGHLGSDDYYGRSNDDQQSVRLDYPYPDARVICAGAAAGDMVPGRKLRE